MKTLVIILIITSFIQSAILPLDLVLIALICRSYIRPDTSNLWLAFGFGLLNTHLNLIALGELSLIYLILVAATESLSKSRLAGNSFLIIPVSLFMMSINQTVPAIITHQTVQLFPKIFWEAFLSLPILYLIRFWEERFIVKNGIKLRI